MERSFGLTFSGRVLTMLIDKGLSREEAYDFVQARAMQAWDWQRPFREVLREDGEVMALLTEEEVESCFDPAWHLKNVEAIFQRLGL